MPRTVNHILVVETGVVCKSYIAAQRETGIYWKRVSDVANGKLSSYAGYTFKRVNHINQENEHG